MWYMLNVLMEIHLNFRIRPWSIVNFVIKIYFRLRKDSILKILSRLWITSDGLIIIHFRNRRRSDISNLRVFILPHNFLFYSRNMVKIWLLRNRCNNIIVIYIRIGDLESILLIIIMTFLYRVMFMNMLRLWILKVIILWKLLKSISSI